MAGTPGIGGKLTVHPDGRDGSGHEIVQALGRRQSRPIARAGIRPRGHVCCRTSASGLFAWIKDPGEPASDQGPDGASDPELLAIKSPAAVFYFLDILKRFDAMEPEVIGQIASAAAVTGRTGLNYGSPDKSYRLPTYGPEALSGLEVMCIMFAAFQRVAPQHDMESSSTTPTKRRLRCTRHGNAKAAEPRMSWGTISSSINSVAQGGALRFQPLSQPLLP